MYNAIIAKIKVSEHPNALRLSIGHCLGFTVVVSKDTEDDQLGIFFPSDGVLSEGFCQANHLYPIYDNHGRKIGGGFIDPKNRRVRAQSFRGVKSEGLWVPLSYLFYLKTSVSHFKEGDSFTEVKGVEICKKYINPATLRAIKSQGNQKKANPSRRETPMFPMLADTSQLKYKISEIPAGSKIYISAKAHGTSGRTSYSPLFTENPGLKERLEIFFVELSSSLNVLKAFRESTKNFKKYDYLTGSRRVIKDRNPGESGFYASDKFRYQATDIVKPFLRKGETIFYEIVGYAGDSKIMPDGDNTKVGDKEFVKEFGKTTEWTYGCLPGQFKILVYDWKICNEDGSIQYSYPWSYIQKRCKDSGVLNTVVNLSSYYVLTENPMFARNNYVTREMLQTIVHNMTEDKFDPLGNHLMEGVCLRVENEGSLVGVYKNKAQSFGILEGYISPDTVNIEELESYQ